MAYFIQLLLEIVDKMGYIGIYIYMFLVGTFVPIPSELVLIPGGYLSSIGNKSYLLLMIVASLGSLSGAMLNYFFALFIVNRFLKGKKIVRKITIFFRKHGRISLFLAPLTPGMGQYISIPAGISKMPIREVVPLIYSANLIWVNSMLLIGYIFGNSNSNHQRVIYVTLGLLAIVIAISTIYVYKNLNQRDKAS